MVRACNAASATAGAVLRPTGSSRMAPAAEAQGPQLLGHREAVRLVAHHDGVVRALDAREACRRLLQHGLPPGEGKQLLRIQLPRQRPQARARPA